MQYRLYLRSFIALPLLLSVFSLFAQNTTNKIAPEVRAAYQRGELPDVLVAFTEQTDLSAAATLHGKALKSEWVFSSLLATAEHSQARARQFLLSKNAKANSFYLVNAIAIEQCPADIAQALAQYAEVKAIALDPWVSVELPTSAADATTTTERNTIEWGIERINAPAVWALGYRGQGITVGGADTGYDWVHPAIKPHYRGYNTATDIADHNYNWHDAIHEKSPLSDSLDNPCGYNINVPCDDDRHGTHTMGTMTGDDNQGNQIGVAPAAQWVACRNMERGNGKPSSYIECFEWFLAPTDQNGQNPNPAKSPHVINNSWYCSFAEGCTDLTVNELIRQAIIALRASGVFVVISNGNAGSNCATTSFPPAYFEESFSVGATQSNDTIAVFSSRGPVTIDGSFRTKPNVSAPGQNIRSSIPNGQYAEFSGTSMSGPHVVGLVALILSANPDLIGEVEQVEDIIESTCIKRDGLVDCSDGNGLTYPNNTYGYGQVNALAAVNKALTSHTEIAPGIEPTAVVFPNPVGNTVYFTLRQMAGPTTLRIFSGTGQLMLDQTKTIDSPESVSAVSTATYSAGIYFWQISNGHFSVSGHFVKS